MIAPSSIVQGGFLEVKLPSQTVMLQFSIRICQRYDGAWAPGKINIDDIYRVLKLESL
jgi:hypothetical protein